MNIALIFKNFTTVILAVPSDLGPPIYGPTHQPIAHPWSIGNSWDGTGEKNPWIQDGLSLNNPGLNDGF